MLNWKKLLIASAILISGISPLWAAKVAKVSFEQEGPEKVKDEQLSFNVRLRPGMDYTRELLDEDVKRLYSTGNFADVVSEVVTLPNDEVSIIFKVKMQPRIKEIKYEGNAKYRVDEFAKEVKIADGGLLNNKLLRESAGNLRKFYEDKGYKEAEITPSVKKDDNGEVTVTFKIVENLRLKINDVYFNGATVFSQWDLRHSIASQYSYMNWLPFINDYLNQGLYSRDEIDLDKLRLRDKYQDKGYLDFKVKDVTVTPVADDPEFVNLTFEIEEGEPYTVSEITIKGNTVYTTEELMMVNKLVVGKTFSRAEELATQKGITEMYEMLGYADMYCKPERAENFKDHTVSINFDISEGRKYTVRDVIIVGNTQTKDKVIRRELAIQPGDPVDRNRIDVSKQRLMGMGYFQKVDASAVNADALDEKDVQIRVQEKDDRYNFKLGAGFSDVNSLVGMAEISNNNFDISDPENWFYGGGQRFRIQGIFGFENQGVNVDFVEPWLFDIPLRFELSGFLNKVEYRDWSEERLGFRTSLTKKFFDDFTSVNVGYKFEYVNVNEISGRLKDYMRENNYDGYQFVSQPSLNLARDTRDSLIDPTRGYNVGLTGAISPKLLGSSENFYRLEGKGSYYYSFWDKAIVAMVGGKIGTIDTFGNGQVPIFEKYFLGGGDTLRGFDYRSVSPVYNGANVGGQSMLLLTSEVTHPIYGPVRGALFIDAGNAWQDSYCMNMNDINIGAGYGLRIKIPQIGAPIKLDLAYPVLNNQEDESNKVRFHFNMGFSI